jgi:anti-sigma regulatory factor (Ser/Thr protein kinase)
VTFEIELPRKLESAAAARQAVGDLVGRLPDDVIGDVRLLVSELVTNALRHADLGDDDKIVLAMDVRDDAVRVEVRDSGKGFEPPGELTGDPERIEGWGLYLVSTLADRWGVEGDGATRVWFELDRSPEAGEDDQAA